MAARVLHVSETTLGGVGGVIADLAAAQGARGDRVSLAAPADDRLTAIMSATGGRHHIWEPGAKPGPRLPLTLVALRRIVTAEQPDLVHLHTSMAGMCGRLVVRRHIPTLFQPHSWSFFALTGAVQRGARVWERWGARWSDVVLCVSEDERRYAERERIRGRFVVIPNGVDLQRWQPVDAGGRTAARERLGVGSGPLAVCVGRLHRQKGQHRVLDAWPAVLAGVPDATLALVGDGPDRDVLLARRPERTVFPGQTSAAEWFAAADVVVQPSVWEGMSLALLEAMATARSVVVTDVPGMREVVRPGCGAVVAPGDAAALAAAIVARLIDPSLAAGEGAAGRAVVEREHDLERQRALVLELTAALARR